jgi:hypothetical protein
MLDEVESHFKQMFPPGHAAFHAVAMDRIRIAEFRGDLEEAARLADRVLAMAEAGEREGSMPVLLRRRAEINVKRRRFALARTDAERAIPLVLARVPAGEFGGSVGLTYLTLGEALAGEGRPSEARAALASAIRHLDATVGGDHPATRRARKLLAHL